MKKQDEIFIKGDKVNLRTLRSEDLTGSYQFWLNDPDIVKYNSHGKFPFSKNMLQTYIDRAVNDDSKIVLAIIDQKSSTHIGNISLQSINWIDRNCEIAFILGDKNYWSKGVMSEAGKLLINHAFNELNLHRVSCGTSSNNLGMQKLATKLGMVKEGVRTESIFNDGKYFDIYEYGIINRYEIL
ncbi:GNAT family N-acetyltransferase [Akkermansiaceae bacterium]|nr:GNAT family N-acetyltransferase [Akkermansiaceae bacterium]